MKLSGPCKFIYPSNISNSIVFSKSNLCIKHKNGEAELNWFSYECFKNKLIHAKVKHFVYFIQKKSYFENIIVHLKCQLRKQKSFFPQLYLRYCYEILTFEYDFDSNSLKVPFSHHLLET